jgi:hypothetical protein
MSTLINRATAMVPSMAWIRNAQAQEEQTRALTEADKFLETFQDQTRSVVECAKALSESDLLPEGFLPAHIQSIVENLVPLRERLTSSPGDIKKRNFWATTQQALDRSVEELRKELLKLWQGHLDEISPPLCELQEFTQSDTFGEELRRVGQLQNRIDLARNKVPRSLDEIEAVKVTGQKIRELLAKLDFGMIPPKVKNFLKAVLLRNVSLSELEPEVHAWLVDKNIAKGFRITSVRSR